MKINNYYTLILLFTSILTLGFISNSTYAATAATLTLSSVAPVSSKVTAFGDPNSVVELHYGLYASKTTTLGSTDQNGYLSITISTDSYDIGCDRSAYVTVNGQRSQTIPWTIPSNSCDTTKNTLNNFSLSENNVVITLGQKKIITLSGIPDFSITNNTNPVIAATISGNNLTLYTTAFGGANITICDSKNQCGVLYVVAINNNNSNQTTTSNAQTENPFSFSISSNSGNSSFVNTGNIITATFSTNKSISNVTAKIDNASQGVSGSGKGPYTITYQVTGKETTPIPLQINYKDSNGNLGQAYFTIGNTSPSQTISTPVTPIPPKFTFTKLLTLNSSGTEVTELQKKLQTLGFFSASPNGHFGPLTEAAVKKFQKKYAITQAGFVGPSTRTKLNQL